MPDGLKRYYGRGDLHFVTFSCYRRLDLLRSKRARTLFVQELARVRRERRFWLAGRAKVKEQLNYMHANPVIRKLVKHPKDWRWSSWSEYMRDEPGLIAIDAVL